MVRLSVGYATSRLLAALAGTQLAQLANLAVGARAWIEREEDAGALFDAVEARRRTIPDDDPPRGLGLGRIAASGDPFGPDRKLHRQLANAITLRVVLENPAEAEAPVHVPFVVDAERTADGFPVVHAALVDRDAAGRIEIDEVPARIRQSVQPVELRIVSAGDQAFVWKGDAEVFHVAAARVERHPVPTRIAFLHPVPRELPPVATVGAEVDPAVAALTEPRVDLRLRSTLETRLARQRGETAEIDHSIQARVVVDQPAVAAMSCQADVDLPVLVRQQRGPVPVRLVPAWKHAVLHHHDWRRRAATKETESRQQRAQATESHTARSIALRRPA